MSFASGLSSLSTLPGADGRRPFWRRFTRLGVELALLVAAMAVVTLAALVLWVMDHPTTSTGDLAAQAQLGIGFVQLVVAIVAVGVTVSYVRLTRAIVEEMKADRREGEATRRRGLSEVAARASLAVVRAADDEVRRHGSVWLQGQRCIDLAMELDGEAFGIDDDELRLRVETCSAAARALMTDEHAYDGNRAVGTLRLAQIMGAARASLEAYLGGRPLPEWDQEVPLGRTVWAWIISQTGGSGPSAADRPAAP